MKTHELLPCPFCGSDEASLSLPTCTKDSKYNPADRAFPSVFCPGCSILVPGRDWDRSGESAIAAWNRRTDPATVKESLTTARTERAQQALDDIDLARKFPVQGGFIEEQPSGWYPCRSGCEEARRLRGEGE